MICENALETDNGTVRLNGRDGTVIFINENEPCQSLVISIASRSDSV